MLALADISQELLRRERSTDEAPRRLLYRDRVSFSFKDGESLRGGMARACELAGAPNSWTVLREVGLKHRNRVLVSEDPDIDIGALAEALGVTREELQRQLARMLGFRALSAGLRSVTEDEIRRLTERRRLVERDGLIVVAEPAP